MMSTSLSKLSIEVIRKSLNQLILDESAIGALAVKFALQEFELYVTKDKRADHPCEVTLPKGSFIESVTRKDYEEEIAKTNEDVPYVAPEQKVPDHYIGRYKVKRTYNPKPDKRYWQVVALRADGASRDEIVAETGLNRGDVIAAIGRQAKYIKELGAIPAGQKRWDYLHNVFGVGKQEARGGAK